MKPILILFASLVTVTSSGCYKNYKSTTKVCNGRLFVERFSHNYIDVAYDYLTDSNNFRMYVGKFDYEHGFYKYNCEGDSIKITEIYEGRVINVRKFSLLDLRK